MQPTGDNNTLTIPPALLAEIQAAAKEERRPAGEVLRDILEHGLEERRRRVHADKERQHARELGLPDEDQPMTDEYRQAIREKIAQGIASARAGRLIDGDSVFARIEAEMAEPERKGQR